MGAIIIPLAVAATAAIIGGTIAAKSAKDVAQKQTDLASDIAGVTGSQDSPEAQSEAYEQEQREAQEKLEAIRAKELRIQSQQYHIQTLADLLKGQSAYRPTVIYTPPTVKEERGIVDRINDYIRGLF